FVVCVSRCVMSGHGNAGAEVNAAPDEGDRAQSAAPTAKADKPEDIVELDAAKELHNLSGALRGVASRAPHGLSGVVSEVLCSVFRAAEGVLRRTHCAINCGSHR